MSLTRRERKSHQEREARRHGLAVAVTSTRPEQVPAAWDGLISTCGGRWVVSPTCGIAPPPSNYQLEPFHRLTKTSLLSNHAASTPVAFRASRGFTALVMALKLIGPPPSTVQPEPYSTRTLSCLTEPASNGALTA